MMLWYAFVVIVVVLHIFTKWSRISKRKGENSFCCANTQQKITKFRLFPVSIPILGGIYILFISRKYGVKAISDLIHNLAPGDKDICKIPFGPSLNMVFFRDAAVTQKLLNSTDPGHLSRPTSAVDQLFDEMLKGGILGTPYEIWTHQRKIISRVFTFQHIKLYHDSMNKHSKILVSELSKLALNTKDGTITGQQLRDCIHLNLVKITFDFIVGSECSEWSEAMQFVQDYSEHKKILVFRLLHPECHDCSPVWWFHPKRKRDKTLRKRMRNFVEKVIKHHEAKKNQPSHHHQNSAKCLIEELIKQNATKQEMYNEVGTFLVVGHETIMLAMEFLLHHFACHPEYQMRCRDEVDDLLSSHSHSDDMSSLTMDDISQLEYLERFILESLRIAPTFPITARELNTPLYIDDTLTLDPGTVVAICPWIIHHDPRYYPQPEVFDPNRFLPEEVEKRGPGTFLAFTGGLRNCIGRRFAMLEMKTVFAWILRNFEICSEDGLHDVKVMFELGIKPERPFRTTLKMRDWSGLNELIR